MKLAWTFLGLWRAHPTLSCVDICLNCGAITMPDFFAQISGSI